jgi:hypothetical protein
LVGNSETALKKQEINRQCSKNGITAEVTPSGRLADKP